ncbi:DNA polymerase III subunit gamma and tau [Nocardia transvalensis]|uniref:DNA polymerase III subunit gamma and tau n=1 Tax=Nocardia transvalensis TaxID=37333 RepID=UPI0018942C27|nr:DNA polymerase III subunit gamma and tau [Nocardia transvalensis]MBF6333293.1 DNA polymerase III subunit gamma and tau [Nocardia transvalensis]
MALYRKYRPATFAEVVGQEHVTDPLSTALDTGRISHAYLFSGPRGCGKTSSARILARSLNCEQGPTSRPCGGCASCVALAPGGPGNLDVIELDAASHGGVDDTRELRDRAFYAPAESRYRVFIVDEAHMVTTAGFNALLKIVEEPPAHLIFVFATTEPDKVLPTIRSRTHHYPFRLLPPATMRGLLGKICEQEGVQVEEAVYPLVIRAGGGSPRDSLSVLDQLLAGAGPEGVAYQRALALLGVTDIALIDDAVEALAADDGAALFGTVDRVVEAGHDPRRFATDLLERIRDLILLRAVPDAAERNLVTGPGDVLDRMRDQAHRIGPATLARYAELLHEGLGEMRGATAPRLLLEVVCARMLLPSASDTESATLQRLERLERRLEGGALPQAPAASAGDRPGSGAAPAAPAEPSGPSRRRGAEALAAIRETRTGKPSAATSSGGSPAGDAAAPASAEPVAASPSPAGGSDQRSAGTPSASGPDEPQVDRTGGQAAPDSSAQPSASAGTSRPHPAQRAQTLTGGEPAQQAESDPAGAPSAPQDAGPSTDNRTAEPEVANESTTGRQPEAEPAPIDADAAQRSEQREEPAVQAVTPVDAVQEAAAPTISSGGNEADLLREVEAKWGEIRAKVREFGAAVHALLSGASVARLEGDVIVFAHQHAPLAQRLSNPKYVEAVQAAIHAVLGREHGVRWEAGTGGGARPQAASTGRAQGGAAQNRGAAAGGRAAGRGQAGGGSQAEAPRFMRPSQARGTAPEQQSARPAEPGPTEGDSGSRFAPPDDDIPLPDGPDYPDDPGPDGYSPVGYVGVPPASTPEEEQEMLAESARPAPPGDRRDPDEVALELLRTELGATRLDG